MKRNQASSLRAGLSTSPQQTTASSLHIHGDSVAADVDTVIALVERNRRKQIESLIAVLDASDTLASHVGVPLTGHTSGGGIMCTPYLWTLEKQISFHQGRLAFGESLLQSAPSTNVGNSTGINAIHSNGDVHYEKDFDVSFPWKPRTATHVGMSLSTPPAAATSMHHAPYPFENPSMLHNGARSLEHLETTPVSAFNRQHQSHRQTVPSRQKSDGESLMDSKFGLTLDPSVHWRSTDNKGKPTADVRVSHHEQPRDHSVLMSYRSLLRQWTTEQLVPASAQRTQQDRSYSASTSTYARGNLTYVKTSRSPSPNAERQAPMEPKSAQFRESKLPVRTSPSSRPLDDNDADHRHSACCGLDIDRWSVRTMMHVSEASLDELRVEYQVALEDCLRTTAVKREEEHARCLMEAMFFASMPTQKVCQSVCKRVQSLEQLLATERSLKVQLEAQVAAHEAQKEQVTRDAHEGTRRMMDDFRNLMSSERSKMRELLDSVCSTTAVAMLDLQESVRWLVEDLQRSEFAQCISASMASFTAHSYHRFMDLTRSSSAVRGVSDEGGMFSNTHDLLNKHTRQQLKGGQRGESHDTMGARDILVQQSWLSDVTSEAAAIFSTKSRHAVSQTDEDWEHGRWLEHSEEQKIRLAWYRKHETFLTLSTAFVFQLEDSERSRIEEEEEDVFVKEQTSWNATAQHFLNLKEAAHKDALVAALQMDLAALRGTASMVSRSTSVGPSGADGFGGSPFYAPPASVGISGANYRSSMIRQHRAASLPQGSLVPSIYEFSHGQHDFMTPESLSSSAMQRQSSLRGPSASVIQPSSRSFYAAVRSISPWNVSDSGGVAGGSAAASRSASVRANNTSFAVHNSFGAMVESIAVRSGGDAADEGFPVPHRQASFGTQTFANTASLRAPSFVRTLAPVALPGMEFPSVPIVVSMALTLEDLGREELMRKEALEWRHMLNIFQHEADGKYMRSA